MNDPRHFALDPAAYGLPSRDELVSLRIWDLHYHGLSARRDAETHEQMMFYVDRLGIERVISLDIGGSLRNPTEPGEFDEVQREVLEREKDRVSGIVSIDPSSPEASLEKMQRWIRDGPCIGIKYAGSNPGGVNCAHPNNDAIIELAQDLDAVVYIHTWIKVGGEPRRAGGGINEGESTPMDVAELASRFPDQPLICGHSGGDWELGVRAIRDRPNVLLEFSGSDSHSGQVDYAVRHLGTERIVWGGHGPSRSFATEMSKILDADLTWHQRRQAFGGNVRRIAAPIFERKGQSMSRS